MWKSNVPSHLHGEVVLIYISFCRRFQLRGCECSEENEIVLWKGLDSGRGVISEEFSFMQQWVLSLADAVVKRGLDPGGLLTWFERTPSPADYNEPLSRWPAAELSITAAQLFSVWEESPSLRGTACILERVSVPVQLLRGKLKRRSQFSLGPLERKDHKGHGCHGNPGVPLLLLCWLSKILDSPFRMGTLKNCYSLAPQKLLFVSAWEKNWLWQFCSTTHGHGDWW